MPKEEISFEDFLKNVSPVQLDYVNETHAFLLTHGCSCKIEAAKSGHVLSYILKKAKRVIANYVFRKNGLIIRIYGDHIGDYPAVLDALPQGMAKAIEKAPTCKRLLDPTKCNARCPMGYVFELNGMVHKKCRYSSFMFEVTEENYAAIRAFLEQELKARAA